MSVKEMSIASVIQEPKTPFYLSEQSQIKPFGHLYFEDDTLVLEFQGDKPVMRIEQTMANSVVDIVGDSSIRIDSPENPEKKIHLFLPSDGKGRFVVYGIRDWTGMDGIEQRTTRKMAYLSQFESTGAKVVAFWQLVLPYFLFGFAFFALSFDVETTDEMDCFFAAWKKLALSPWVTVHYVFLLIPAISILFFKRTWGLRTILPLSLVLVLVVSWGYYFPIEWLSLTASESPLIFPQYWLIFAPYLILLMLPSIYYVIVLRRL